MLHDLNHASRYADHIIAMKDGAVAAEGAPADVITESLVEEVFGMACRIIDDPVTHTPLVVPLGRPRHSAVTD
ncbi:putative siderophore transport system ATP-binding protein YusV [compost metagenome]